MKKLTKADATSKKPTNSLARRMHDGYEKQIKRKLAQSKGSNCTIPQDNWDAIFGNKNENN